MAQRQRFDYHSEGFRFESPPCQIFCRMSQKIVPRLRGCCEGAVVSDPVPKQESNAKILVWGLGLQTGLAFRWRELDDNSN